ncbi:hypothetical protein Zmor_019459 [Zophobas morio]|uniref:Uncharacterized protein n=1 Tax=Zophobas morio TaxID=2755281 RepID=A0AA38M8T9_9CUCU|nr:hypothetical protein Zmor_019459 [Zophobas morio]
MTWVRLIFSFTYTLVGLSGCFAFFYFKNYPAAVLAVATGVINAILSHLHFLNHRNQLQEWYNPSHLRQISWFGFYSFAVSTSILVYFAVLEIMDKKPLLPIQDSAVIAMVWCLITLKSGLILQYYARSYSKHNHTLLREEPAQEETSAETQEITP